MISDTKNTKHKKLSICPIYCYPLRNLELGLFSNTCSSYMSSTDYIAGDSSRLPGGCLSSLAAGVFLCTSEGSWQRMQAGC